MKLRQGPFLRRGRAPKKQGVGALRPRLAGLAALALGLLSLGLPAACVGLQEARLLARPLARPAVEGALSEAARELPLAWALCQRRYLEGAAYCPPHTPAPPARQAGLLAAKTAALHEAGLLDDALANALGALLAQPAAEAGGLGDGLPQTAGDAPAAGRDFSAAQYSVWSEQEETGGSLVLYWHTDTGRVVHCDALLPEMSAVPEPGAPEMSAASPDTSPESAAAAPQNAAEWDAAGLLARYRVYLGVDGLDDWAEQPLPGAEGAACWSAKGQLYLFCARSGQRFVLSAVSLAPGEMPAGQP